MFGSTPVPLTGFVLATGRCRLQRRAKFSHTATASKRIASRDPYPIRLRVVLRLDRLVRPFAGLLPPRLNELLQLLPSATPSTPAAVFTPTHAARRRVALVAGCVQQVMGAHINDANHRLLQRHGCEVVSIGGDACCGALNLRMGHELDGLACTDIKAYPPPAAASTNVAPTDREEINYWVHEA